MIAGKGRADLELILAATSFAREIEKAERRASAAMVTFVLLVYGILLTVIVAANWY
jgi:hypothetical protein